mgnify:CR=1 FL=1
MRKSLKIIVPILLVGVLGYFGYGMLSKIKQKKEVAERIGQIPDFSFQTLESQDFVKGGLKDNAPVIFLFFNSECEYCQEEAEYITKSIAKFKGAQLIFVSNESIESAKIFAENYKLLEHENIKVLLDPRSDFTELFGATSIPYTIVYDKNQNLVKEFKGYVEVEKLINSIQ